MQSVMANVHVQRLHFPVLRTKYALHSMCVSISARYKLRHTTYMRVVQLYKRASIYYRISRCEDVMLAIKFIATLANNGLITCDHSTPFACRHVCYLSSLSCLLVTIKATAVANPYAVSDVFPQSFLTKTALIIIINNLLYF